MGARALLAACLLTVAGAAHAQVIEIRPDGGVVTYAGPAIYTDAGVRSLRPSPASTTAPPRAAPAAVAEAIRLSSQRHSVSPSLLEAVAWQESRFHQEAVSPKGARGVMQLMPGTARDLGADADDLGANIDGGAAYLSRMMTRFNGDLSRALAAYNAGPEAVARFNGVPPYAETQTYVRSILGRLAQAGLTPGVPMMAPMTGRMNARMTRKTPILLTALTAVAMAQPAWAQSDPTGSSPLVGALNWVQGTLLGNLATTAAVIAVAACGFLMLTGRMDWRRGLTVVIGCFIIFGAVTIVAGIRSAAQGFG